MFCVLGSLTCLRNLKILAAGAVALLFALPWLLVLLLWSLTPGCYCHGAGLLLYGVRMLQLLLKRLPRELPFWQPPPPS